MTKDERFKKVQTKLRRWRKLLREAYVSLDPDERDAALCARILKELKPSSKT